MQGCFKVKIEEGHIQFEKKEKLNSGQDSIPHAPWNKKEVSFQKGFGHIQCTKVKSTKCAPSARYRK